MLKAVIFDVDGTLVDSVDLHAHAWVDAFQDFGHEVGFKEAREQIGKGGDQLLPVFLSEEEIDRKGKALEKHREKVLKCPSKIIFCIGRAFAASAELMPIAGMPARFG